MESQKPAIVVHGGAGEWQPERREAGIKGVEKAASIGFEVLKRGGAALDAVEAAVAFMEDNEVFNAGRGSSLTIDKRVEMEAAIMDGKTLNAGAAGLLEDIKNPVRLARIVMENTDHVFVVGEGAKKLAELFRLEKANPISELRLKYWHEAKEKLAIGKLNYLPRLYRLIQKNPTLFQLETVGAAAIDIEGNLAAATSTGGISLKIPGRIGDTPLIGCGTYADNEAGACSATGIGEIAIRFVLAKTACDYMRNGFSAQIAVENSIKNVNRRLKDVAVNQIGLIAVDSKGGIGAAHNSPHLCWAFMSNDMKEPRAALTAKIVKETA
ncbi:MAG: isoaspartyl peptidase/L-asparaginase [Candidatus Bathyarchaeia archaeon]